MLSSVKIAFRYFCLNAISSLLILFCIFGIYLTFGALSFDEIANSLILVPKSDGRFVAAIFVILAFAISIKFFPFWLYFEKLKSTNIVASFLAIESLFIKTGIGIFITLKFVYFFFGNSLVFSSFNFKPILLFIALILVFYSCSKLYSQRHLKMISAYLCLNNLGLILGCIALQKIESLQALFFYLLNFTLVSLFIFIFATFLKRHFFTSSAVKIWLVGKNNFALILPLKLLVFSIAAFPLTNLFFANWYLSYASFDLGLELFLLVAIALSNFVYISQAAKIVNSFFTQNAEESKAETAFAPKNYSFYLASFWLLILVIFASIFASNLMNDISLKFASYLLSHTI